MQTIRTIKCKISIPSERLSELHELFDCYASACTTIAQWGRDNKISNAIRLHHKLYRNIRSEFGLPANLTVTALRCASGSLKTAKLKGKFEFRATFIGLDERTFTVNLKKNFVTFSSLGKRIKAQFDIGDYQREALSTVAKVTSATLVRSKKGFFINISIKADVPDAIEDKVMGIDLGIRNIAVTSEKLKIDGTYIREYRENRLRIRSSLQSKGTRGAKRVLRKLSGREKRRAAHLNHEIAKRIVSEAVKSGCSTIIFERLKGIRNRLRIPCKHLNRMISLWSFFQLREFIRYKAAMRGIKISEMDPAYTSQTCHICRIRGKRNRETFVCTTCGEFDADLNAAKNIAAGGVPVSAPKLTVVSSHN